MSKTIFKYQLSIKDTQNINLPANSEPLSVQIQNGVICVWFVVDTSMPTEIAEINIFGTGHSLPDVMGKHIGAVQLNSLVWHVFIN